MSNLAKHTLQLKTDIVDNYNKNSRHPGCKRFHLKLLGSNCLAINFSSIIKVLQYSQGCPEIILLS